MTTYLEEYVHKQSIKHPRTSLKRIVQKSLGERTTYIINFVCSQLTLQCSHSLLQLFPLYPTIAKNSAHSKIQGAVQNRADQKQNCKTGPIRKIFCQTRRKCSIILTASTLRSGLDLFEIVRVGRQNHTVRQVWDGYITCLIFFEKMVTCSGFALDFKIIC